MNLACIKEHVIKESFVKQDNELLTKYFKLLKENPLLRREQIIMEAIESKTFGDRNIAQKYLDSVISSLPKRPNVDLTLFKEEKESVNEIMLDIHNVLHNRNNIDLFIESYERVLNHLTKEKDEEIDEETISLMEDIYKSKYSQKLNEEEEKFIDKFSAFSDDEKKDFFYYLKTQKLIEMYETVEKGKEEEKGIIKEAINKLKDLQFSEEAVIELYVL